jgi:ribosomal protein S18 acetylase RimI-like enzyme
MGYVMIEMRPYLDESDLAPIAELIAATPYPGRHCIDYPWRLSAHDPASPNVRLWIQDGGLLVGFAAWQIWWATLDFYIRPGPTAQEVEAAIFAWAAGRFQELDAERGQPLPYWVEAHEDDLPRLALLARQGYTLDADYRYLLFSLPLRGPEAPPLAPASLPEGFAIRPLAGAQEVDAYVALHRRAFASTSMTAAWRARTLRMPCYEPELDLVATAPDGRLAGFCVGWLAPERQIAQIEPVGVDPEFQGLGLGRALLLEMLRRFAAHGAGQAQVETESSRSPARSFYEAIGFRPIAQTLRKGRWFTR